MGGPGYRTRSESIGENKTRTKEKSLTAQKRGHYNRPHEHLTEESASFSHTPVAQPFCSSRDAFLPGSTIPQTHDRAFGSTRTWRHQQTRHGPAATPHQDDFG